MDTIVLQGRALRFFNIFAAIGVVFNLSACGESFSEQPPAPEDKVNILCTDCADENLPLFSIDVEELPEFGSYAVKFKVINDMPVSIIRHDLATDEIEEIALKTTEFTDEDVISGRSYGYDIGVYEGDKTFRLIERREVRIPLDIGIGEGESRRLSEFAPYIADNGTLVLSVSRMDFDNGGSFITEGERVHLKVEKLFSVNGKIETFSEGSTAPIGTNGKSGGEILLEVASGVGNIHFVLRGENGGKGKQGKSGKTGKRGSKRGSDGLASHRVTVLKGGEGGIKRFLSKYPSNDLVFPSEDVNVTKRCVKKPGPGSQGGRGGNGGRGKNGMKGGDSGLATVHFKSGEELKVTYKLIAGKAGEPGDGGERGAGGLSGPTGREKVEYEGPDGRKNWFNNTPEICPAAVGKAGPRGNPGPKGKPGTSGGTQSFCTKMMDQDTVCFQENQ